MTSPKPAPQLGQAAARFLDTLKVPKTRKNRAEALDPMVTRFGPDLPLQELDPADVADWIAERWGEFSSATQNSRTAAVRAAWTWWAERRWISRDDLADALEVLKRVKDKAVLPAEILTRDEVQALLRQPSRKYPTGIRNYALLVLLARSGLRIGELIALRPADLDHAKRSIRVLDTKTGQAQTRYWHHSADDALLRWEDRRRQLGINGRAPLFCTLKGAPLSDKYVREMLGRYAHKAGIIKRVHPHGFRHAFAAELEAEGVSVTEISMLLGHAGTAVTSRYLAHLTSAQAGRALAGADLPSIGGTSSCTTSDADKERIARLEEQVQQLLAERQQ